MRCVDVAALVAAAILRRNPDSVVVPFDTQAFDVRIDPSDSILSLSERLAKFGGGGTDCSLPIRKANANYAKRKFAGVVLVSDMESWVYQGRPYFYGANGSSGVVTEWQKFVQNQIRLQGGDITGPKLICIDLQPNTTTQAPERSDILNVGGFSDAVFHVIAAFLEGDANRFVAEVESATLQEHAAGKRPIRRKKDARRAGANWPVERFFMQYRRGFDAHFSSVSEQSRGLSLLRSVVH
jgi:60 kDa SS-A/Ro ribonucleoprotein